MELVSLKQLFQKLSNGGRLLGLDVGSRNIGLAVSDLKCRVASPHRFKNNFYNRVWILVLALLTLHAENCNLIWVYFQLYF